MQTRGFPADFIDGGTSETVAALLPFYQFQSNDAISNFPDPSDDGEPYAHYRYPSYGSPSPHMQDPLGKFSYENLTAEEDLSFQLSEEIFTYDSPSRKISELKYSPPDEHDCMNVYDKYEYVRI